MCLTNGCLPFLNMDGWRMLMDQYPSNGHKQTYCRNNLSTFCPILHQLMQHAPESCCNNDCSVEEVDEAFNEVEEDCAVDDIIDIVFASEEDDCDN